MRGVAPARRRDEGRRGGQLRPTRSGEEGARCRGRVQTGCRSWSRQRTSVTDQVRTAVPPHWRMRRPVRGSCWSCATRTWWWTSEALVQLVEALDADRGLAIVGPRVLEPNGSRYPSARRFPSLTEGAGHALAGLVAPNNRFTRRYRMQDDDPEATTRVDWVSGSFMAMRRAAFEELGGFDESYFMYGEDVDLCWRAHMAGWGVVDVPSACVTHTGGITTKRTPYRMLACHHRSALRFAGRTLSGPRRLVLPVVGLALGVRLVLELARQAASSLNSRGSPSDVGGGGG